MEDLSSGWSLNVPSSLTPGQSADTGSLTGLRCWSTNSAQIIDEYLTAQIQKRPLGN